LHCKQASIHSVHTSERLIIHYLTPTDMRHLLHHFKIDDDPKEAWRALCADLQDKLLHHLNSKASFCKLLRPTNPQEPTRQCMFSAASSIVLPERLFLQGSGRRRKASGPVLYIFKMLLDTGMSNRDNIYISDSAAHLDATFKSLYLHMHMHLWRFRFIFHLQINCQFLVWLSWKSIYPSICLY